MTFSDPDPCTSHVACVSPAYCKVKGLGGERWPDKREPLRAKRVLKGRIKYPKHSPRDCYSAGKPKMQLRYICLFICFKAKLSA